MAPMKHYDAVIAGGGLIGASIAFELAQAGLHVALFDAQQPGREASWASAGIISPAPENPSTIPLLPLSRASAALYPAFVKSSSRTHWPRSRLSSIRHSRGSPHRRCSRRTQHPHRCSSRTRPQSRSAQRRGSSQARAQSHRTHRSRHPPSR